jgi:L-alanine-DL-glutamate epimerase-like enolase superfamily enzyme
VTGASGVSVRSVGTAAYQVPTDAPEGDGTFAWDSTTLVVVTVTGGGRSGTGWTYGPTACASLVDGMLEGVVVGTDPFDVVGTNLSMRRAVRNAGLPGVAAMAISAVDVALWDLKARLLELPLHRLLGTARSEVAVYGSGGFTTYDEEQLTSQLEGWTDQGIPRVKIKIGESDGRRTDRDLQRVRLARRVVGDDVELFVDANGGYDVGQARRMAAQLDAEGVRWFEEPVTSDDLDGLRRVRGGCLCDVTAGEYGYNLTYFERMCAAGAVDCLQIDASRCGGISEWLRAAAVAAGHHLDVSGHCAPHLHVAAAAATPNVRHLEWFHDHVRIESMLFEGALDPAGGTLTPTDDPGHGLTFKHSDAEKYLR